MSTRVEELLIELSQDPFRAMQFRTNSGPDVSTFGLTAEEADVLISGDVSDLDRTFQMRKAAIMGAKKPKAKKKKKATKKK